MALMALMSLLTSASSALAFSHSFASMASSSDGPAADEVLSVAIAVSCEEADALGQDAKAGGAAARANKPVASILPLPLPVPVIVAGRSDVEDALVPGVGDGPDGEAGADGALGLGDGRLGADTA